MNIVPDHVKELVDRLVAEYEKAYEAGDIFYTRLTVGDRVLLGRETTQYYLDCVKSFRKNLDSEDGHLFKGDSKEVIKKIYHMIIFYYEHLSIDAINRIKNVVECQGQLYTALAKAKKIDSLKADAESMMKFIDSAAFSSWGQMDSCVERRKFVLVKNEEKFEGLLRAEEVEELTPGTIEPFLRIRVAFEEISVKELYRKKNILRKYLVFWHKYGTAENADEYFKILNLWNNIAKTAIYYVYVPNK